MQPPRNLLEDVEDEGDDEENPYHRPDQAIALRHGLSFLFKGSVPIVPEALPLSP
jgi:hypothetical protein